MIFGELLTGSNFDDTEKKITGGRNGFGAKLANIFSKKFSVLTGDPKKGKSLKIIWKKNMSEKLEPIVKNYEGESFTEITFYPDLSKFGMKELTTDMVKIFEKRVLDLGGVLPSKVKVYLNGVRLEANNFDKYCQLYFKTNSSENSSKINDNGSNIDDNDDNNDKNEILFFKTKRWEIGIALSESSFKQVSFVNSICTIRGGTHVNYIVDQIISKTTKEILKKHKKANVKPYMIRNSLFIFVNCLIENPVFDSQTKETLKLSANKFGSSCELTDNFLSKIMKTGIVEQIVFMAKAKEEAAMAKTLSAKKKRKLIGFKKLEDANMAGSAKSSKCLLILTEGDSAKSFAMAGLEIVGRDYYGVYPLRGKLLNVREASIKAITGNKEIQDMMNIIGLQIKKNYKDISSLRYGGIMIMTDQDVDGSHIKGLIINFISNFWPSLINIHGFIVEFVTPILKAFGPRKFIKPFFTIQEYKIWADAQNDISKFRIKYYKGLGTSSEQEAREYFRNLQEHRIKFFSQGNQDLQLLDMVFNKKKADERKNWLENYNEDIVLDHTKKNVSFGEFVNKEMIHFSAYNNQRAISHLLDGLKPSRRKILFGCFKKNLKQEIKVAQLSGYVSEHVAYHHGEVSLQGTIVNLAQNFVGSNNIHLLEPLGQYGTRLMGGADHASARYIHTKLSPIARKLFIEHDDHLLDYNLDDGKMVEPKFYIPILPLCLINGATGIGTGWSSTIPPHNVRQIAKMILDKLENDIPFEEITPWYKGYYGPIEKIDDTQYSTQGIYTIDKNAETIRITELPIGKWTRNYKNFLEDLIKEEKHITDFKEYHTVNRVDFLIQLKQGELRKLNSDQKILKTFKLQTNINLTNLVLFNKDNKIRKFNNTKEILEQFYEQRIYFYHKRKDYLSSMIERDLEYLQNKIRFIKMIIEDKLVLKRRSAKEIVNDLMNNNFTMDCDMKPINSTKLNMMDKKKGVIEEQKEENQSASENESEEESENGNVI